MNNTKKQQTAKKKKISIDSDIFLVIGMLAVIVLIVVFAYSARFSDRLKPTFTADELKTHIADSSTCYHYNQLDDYGKIIYDEILEQSINCSLLIDIKGIKKSDYNENYENQLNLAVTAFVYDHPEFFWLSSAYYSSYSFNTLSIALGTRPFWTYTTDKEGLIARYFDEVDEIVNAAKEYDTDCEKLKYVHDYLVHSITYNYDAFEDCDDGNWSIQNDYAFSSYGGIVNDSCVCAGYASAFQVIVQQLGIECAYVVGETTEGLHAWNLVNLDGEYYWFDVTWDDIGSWGWPTDIRYTYFATTDAVMLEDHTPHYFDYPDCNSEKYINPIQKDLGY